MLNSFQLLMPITVPWLHSLQEYWMSNLVIDAFLNWRIELRHVQLCLFLCTCMHVLCNTNDIKGMGGEGGGEGSDQW